MTEEVGALALQLLQGESVLMGARAIPETVQEVPDGLFSRPTLCLQGLEVCSVTAGLR